MALKTKRVVYINHFYITTVLTNYRLTTFLLYVGYIIYYNLLFYIYL